MTREEAKEAIAKAITGDMEIQLIDQIFDEHKVQLKAKDEEIKNLSEIIQQYLIPSKNYETIIRGKNETIAELKECCEIYKENIKSLKEAHDEIVKLERKKARSIIIQPTTCEGCDNEGCDHVFSPCDICSRKFSDNYEPKEL